MTLGLQPWLRGDDGACGWADHILGEMRPRFDWPLVGRSRELTAAREVLERASEAPGPSTQRGLVFVGSEGVGLTRMQRAVAELANDLGWPVVSLAGSPGLQAHPLGVVASLLADQLTDLTRSVRSLLVEAQRALLADAVDGRLAIIVDDAHYLDELSATLVELLVTRSGSAVFATAKLGVPLPEALGSLLRRGWVDRVTVGALDDDRIEVLVDHCLHPKADGVTRNELVRASQGNPLALREAIAAAFESGSLAPAEGVWMLSQPLGVAPRLAELVAAHLDGLESAEIEALELLAVGQPVGAAAMLGVCSSETLQTLERRGLIQLMEGGRRPEISLAQSMFADTLRARLGPLRRASLFASLIEAGEADWAIRRRQSLRAAMFYLESGQSAPVDLLVQAAHLAHLAVDPERELRLLRLAWETSHDPAVGRYLARALNMMGLSSEAVSVLRSAFDQELDDDELKLVGTTLAMIQLRGLGDSGGAHDTLDRLRDRFEEPSLRAMTQAMAGLLAFLQGDPARCFELCEPLVGEGDLDWPAADAASCLGAALVFDGRTDQAASVAQRAFAFRVRSDDHRRPLEAAGIHVMNNFLAVCEAGQIDSARNIARSFYDLCVAERNVIGQAWTAVCLGRVDFLAGRFRSASRWFQEGSGLAQRVHDRLVNGWGLAWLALTQVSMGELAAADETLAECARGEAWPLCEERGVLTLARIWRIARQGDVGLAIEQLDGLASEAASSRRRGLAAVAVRDLVRLGASERALAHVPSLGDLEGELFPMWCSYAAAASGRSAVDLDHVSRELERLGLAWFASEAALEAGRAFAAAGETQASARAVRRARVLAQSCDWVGDEQIAVIDDAGPLRGRELEVARMAAAQLSNREIAERLVVSLRTVENHLHRAFGKLGIESRSELVDLVPPASPAE